MSEVMFPHELYNNLSKHFVIYEKPSNINEQRQLSITFRNDWFIHKSIMFPHETSDTQPCTTIQIKKLLLLRTNSYNRL